MGNLHWLDHLVIAAYLCGVMGLGFLFRKQYTRADFFTTGSTMGWLPVGLSVMATLFSANSFVMYPSAAYGDSLKIGLSLIAFVAMAPVVVWVFIPVYSRLGCQTAYDYLERRFHVSVRCLASGLFILLRIGWMASATFAASVVVSNISGMHQVTVILTIGAVSIAYTILGGLRAVMWTDVMQFFIFSATILMAVILLIAASEGGLSGMWESYFAGRENLIVDFTPSMTLRYGSWVILVGMFLEGLSAFGADQVAVQRYIAARSEKTSQIGFGVNLAGMFLIIPGLLLIGVGLYGYFQQRPQEMVPVLERHISEKVQQGTGDLAANSPLRHFQSSLDNKQADSNQIASDVRAYYQAHPDEVAGDVRALNLQDLALPQFVKTKFRPGMVGLLLAAVLAAMMSSIDSGIHSVTTAIVVDFRDRLFPQWKPDSQIADMRLMRAMILLIGAISVTLACFVGPLGDVFDVAKKLTAAFGGPLLAVFILALFVRSATTRGVFIGALIATAMTMALMYQCSHWFSVWFWPIGFGTALSIGWLLSLAMPAKAAAGDESQLTYWEVMRRSRR